MLTWYTGNGEDVVIPDGVKEIDDGAFDVDGGRSLVSVVIPDGVTRIGDSAFSGCRNLTDVKIPGSVKNIGSNAFFTVKA